LSSTRSAERSAGSRERDEPLRAEARRELDELALAPDERSPARRQDEPVERSRRWEFLAAELEERDRLVEVLQAMPSELADRPIDQLPRRLSEQDLPAVGGRCDACASVHVEPDVPLVRHCGLPGVKPHPDSHRSRRQRLLRLLGGRGRIARAGERDQERVALGVHLHPAVCGNGVAKHGSVLGQRRRVVASQLAEQPRRPLDVREEERHRPGGQGPHGPR
jgi:hypothetical protein